jgi:hypothetical protein
MSDWFQVGSNIGSTNTTTALSSDGSIMVVGSPENGDNNEGQVNVYQKSVITGEYEQLGSSIDGDVSSAKFGTSVAINPNGDIIAVGAPGESATSNYVRVYQYSGGSWSKLGSDITGGSKLGFSVSISSDGTVLAIGQPGFNSSRGRTLVYRYSSESWNLEETINGSSFGNELGFSVSLSDAGTILAIGNPKLIFQGGVRVYEYSSNSWNLLKDGTNNEIKHFNPTNGDKFGYCVSVSGNGEVIGIAVPTRGNGDKGLVMMYQRSGDNWVQMASDNSPNGNIIGENIHDGDLGLSISLSYDGMTVAIGAQNNSSANGHVRVYKFENNSWINKIGSDIDGNVTDGEFGASVSLSSDGTIVSVGSAGSSARVFEYGVDQITIWNQLGQDINGINSDLAGYSVSLSSNGTIIAIGYPGYITSSSKYMNGKVSIYQYNNTSWNKLGQDIKGEASYDESGYSVSLSNDGSVVAIGAPFNNGNGADSGHVRVYQYNSSSWIKLGDDIDGEAEGDRSGSSVSLSSDGTIVAIGAIYNDGNGSNSGHVKVYQYNSSSWIQLGNDIDGEAESNQSGYSISLSSDGTIVAIGAPHNAANQNSGHVRVYQYNNTSWIKLGDDIDGEGISEESGYSVSLSSDGTIVAIGASKNGNNNGANSGMVRVYKYSNSSWNKLGQNIKGEAESDQSGWSVSLSSDGTILAIGTPENGTMGNKRGYVRVYQYNGSSWNKLGENIYGDTLGDESGRSVSLSNDGTIIAVGAIYNSNNKGLVRVYKNIYTTDVEVETVLEETPTEFDTKKRQINNSNITNTYGNIFSTKNSSQKRIQRKFISKGILKKHKTKLVSGDSIYADPDTLGFTETELTEKTRFRIFNASATLNSSDSIPLDTEINVNDLPEGEGFHVVLENTSDTIKLIGTDNKFIEVTKTYKGQYYINKNDESNEIMDEGDTLDLYDIYLKLGSVSGGSRGQTPSSNICFIGSTLMQTDQGQEQISKLIPGFHTINGKKIKFITETITKDTHLYKIKRNALGKNIPSREMTVTGNHLVEFDFVLIPVRVLSTELEKIEEVKYRGEKLYNILMDKHEIIKVNNLNVETLHPNNLIARLYNNKNSKIWNTKKRKNLLRNSIKEYKKKD